jgi:hypothetical protein
VWIDRSVRGHERISARVAPIAQERAGVAPDGIELPGVPGTVGYVSLAQYSLEKIADMLIAKLKS